MTPVKQTRFGARLGNCFAACVASILEVDLSIVPELAPAGCGIDEGEQQNAILNRWLADLGLAYVEVAWEPTAPGFSRQGMTPAPVFIATLQSPDPEVVKARGSHAVVAKLRRSGEKFEVVVEHDPKGWVDNADYKLVSLGMFVVVNPHLFRSFRVGPSKT